MAARRKKARRGHAAPKSRPGRAVRPRADAGVRRARLWLLGAAVLAVAILFAWFPGSSLLSQRSSLAGTAAALAALHKQDRALSQEKKSLSGAGEIGRIARSQYQLVSPGQQAYEVLPPSGAATGTPSGGDPGSGGPVEPSASAELPSGTTTTTVPTSGSASDATHGAHGAKAPAAQAPGLLSRIVHSLEFWR